MTRRRARVLVGDVTANTLPHAKPETAERTVRTLRRQAGWE